MVLVYERLFYTLLNIGTCFWNTIKNSTCRYCLSQFVAWLHNDCQWGNILSKELWHLQKKWWPITDSSCHMTYILLTLFKPQHSYFLYHELCNSLHNGNVVFFLLKSHFQLIILSCLQGLPSNKISSKKPKPAYNISIFDLKWNCLMYFSFSISGIMYMNVV